MFFKAYLKWFWIFNTKHDPSGNSNSSWYVGVDILSLLCNVCFFYIFLCIVNAKVWHSKIFVTSFKFILSERLSNSLWDQMFYYSENS